MNLIELYALTAAKKINKIYTFEKYYPLPFNNYIVLQNQSKASKNYAYWRSVLDLLYPILNSKGIRIVQVGAPGEVPLNHCYPTFGANWGQLEYLISHSKLVLTTDSVSAHLGGRYDLPIVDLVSNNFSECVRPYFGDRAKQIILEPDRTNKLPSFSLDEGPNPQINEIKPEDIVAAVCKLLNLDFPFTNKTIYRGIKFNSNVIFETIPNQAIQLQSLGIDSILVRMDYLFNEQALVQQLQFGNASIITDKPINIDILKQFRPRIRELVYFVDNNHNPEFVKEIRKIGLNLILISELPPEQLNPIKLHYMDIGVINPKPQITKENIETLKGKDTGTLYYQSNKFTLGAGKIYQSKAAWLQDKPLNSLKFEFQPVIDSPDFWNESESFWLTAK